MEIRSIFDFINYKYQHWITLLVFITAMVLLYYSANSFLSCNADNFREFIENKKNAVFIMIWIFGPPTWFYFERYVLWRDAGDCKKKSLQEGRDLAKPFWAAALYFLFLMVPK